MNGLRTPRQPAKGDEATKDRGRCNMNNFQPQWKALLLNSLADSVAREMRLVVIPMCYTVHTKGRVKKKKKYVSLQLGTSPMTISTSFQMN